METAQTTNEELIYAGLPQTRTNKNTIASYPTDNTTSPNDFVAKVQATAGSQKVGPSLTLKVMTGDTINIRVNSWYKLNGATPSAPQSPLTNIVTSLISGISGSAVVNTHGVTSNQFNTANTFIPDVTSFLNNQTNNTTGGKPKAFINWIFFDEQFNIVQSASGFEQVGDDTELKLHVKQPVATKCGFLYVYVSNETPNIPVYFDNLQVSHIRSPLLETNEYYPYGLKMASISYKASMTMTNRFGWNGGNEYEDEGELNYSNTFYRKYDAQIGRFTGIDMKAEAFKDLTPYQFGNNNPAMFNDPMGDQTRALSQNERHPIHMSNWENSGKETQNADYSEFWNYFLSIAFETAGPTSIQTNIPGFGNSYFGLDLANMQWGFFAMGTTTNAYAGNNQTINALSQTLTDLATSPNSANSVVRSRFFAMLNDNITHNIYSSTTSLPAVITNAQGNIVGTNTNFGVGATRDPLDRIERNGRSNNRATFAADFLSTTYNNSRGVQISVSQNTFNGWLSANGSVTWVVGNRNSQRERNVSGDNTSARVSKNAMDYGYIENAYRSRAGLELRTFFRDQYWSPGGGGLELVRLRSFNATNFNQHNGIFFYNGFHF